MTEIIFEIKGNQENPDGNPIGYHRTTQGSTWTPEHQRYEAWKWYVQKEYQKVMSFRGHPVITRVKASDYKKISKENLKPIELGKGQTARVDISIEYANNARPDNDNVYKGILDALFVNDKYVMAGSFESKMSEDKKGRVLVKIKIS